MYRIADPQVLVVGRDTCIEPNANASRATTAVLGTKWACRATRQARFTSRNMFSQVPHLVPEQVHAAD